MIRFDYFSQPIIRLVCYLNIKKKFRVFPREKREVSFQETEQKKSIKAKDNPIILSKDTGNRRRRTHEEKFEIIQKDLEKSLKSKCLTRTSNKTRHAT